MVESVQFGFEALKLMNLLRFEQNVLCIDESTGSLHYIAGGFEGFRTFLLGDCFGNAEPELPDSPAGLARAEPKRLQFPRIEPTVLL